MAGMGRMEELVLEPFGKLRGKLPSEGMEVWING
jgi:hypothetical protein